MASNDAQPSLGTESNIKTEVVIDDGPSTSKSAIEMKEDIIEMDVDGNDQPIDILNDLCKMKIKIEKTSEGITELSVESPDVDNSGLDVTWSSEDVRGFMEFKIREYLKDSQVNRLLQLYKRSLELKEILKEKNEEYLKIQKLMEMIFRNQEKFLREVGVMPRIPMYSRGVSVDLPFLPPSESLKLPKLLLNSNPAQTKTAPTPKPTPTPAASNSTKSSAGKDKDSIECIDLTDDQDSSDKSQKGSSTSGVVSHPAPFPPRPITSLSQDNNNLKIPPKPRLKVKGDSQGIILQWDMPSYYNTQVHAQVTAYEIFGYQVVPKHTVCTLLWKKIGTVKAMTLPMACTLTQFQEGNKYFFAIRAIDSFNRCSNFSEALSIVYNSRNEENKAAK